MTRQENEGTVRGFRVFLGGGLGAGPQEAKLYTDFLPATEIFTFSSAILRLFDRYGERKSRMKARMKFLVNTMGWDAFRQALDAERREVGDDNVFERRDRLSVSYPATPSENICQIASISSTANT